MKILLDTNIVIHREAAKGISQDIGSLFYWLDRLGYKKYVHPITIEELNRNKDPQTVAAMSIKVRSYNLIKNPTPMNKVVSEISRKLDESINDINDTVLLNEVYSERVDYLISEDKKIHFKAQQLGIGDRVFKIDQFLEKALAENPDLVDYKVLAVKKVCFAQVKLKDSFFDSFRDDYMGFDKWFVKKSDEVSYVCYQEDKLSAFLYIKVEEGGENYSDIIPAFRATKRLKIGTFKVISNGFRIGERFLKIVFDNALQYNVSEIYLTIFDNRPEQLRLIQLIEEWGFTFFGIKRTENGEEKVYVKNFEKSQEINLNNPRRTFPFISKDSKVFIVPIYPEYHTELFPDSILRTESPLNFSENEPHRNALSKVYISRSYVRDLSSGDIIVFYRTGGVHKGVATTYGIVESVVDNISDEATFLKLCRKRSVFSDDQLKTHWNYNKKHKPFVVNFIYAHSFRKRPTLRWLNENGIIPDILDMPRGFREIGRDNFLKIANYSLGR